MTSSALILCTESESVTPFTLLFIICITLVVSLRATLICRNKAYINKLVYFDLIKSRLLVTPLYQMNFPDSHLDKSATKKYS